MLAWRNAKQELEYVLPKWKMEDTESAMQTALREISEETWLVIGDLDIIKFLSTIEYSYYANHIEGSPIVHKEVHLYLVKYRGKKEPRPPIKERFFGYKWFSLAGMKNLHLKPDVVW
jgi:8-oxo-dGTP pyrophosphatase MutT (NUDIX family)